MYRGVSSFRKTGRGHEKAAKQCSFKPQTVHSRRHKQPLETTQVRFGTAAPLKSAFIQVILRVW